MKLVNDQGQAVYYNIVSKHGNDRYIIKALSGQILRGRDGERLRSRSFAQEHQAEAFLRRQGYKTVG